jgi:hypothetical protein
MVTLSGCGVRFEGWGARNLETERKREINIYIDR